MDHHVIADLAAERLAKAMELIKNPKDWCQGMSGQDVAGFMIAPWAPTCVRRCALGSVSAASQGLEDPVHEMACDALEEAACRQHDGAGVVTINDSIYHRHADVLALFPLAIEDLRVQAARRKTEMGIPTAPAVWSARMTTQHAAAIQPAA